MASPFKYFRKHQKVMLAILGVLAMFGFVILPVIMQGMGSGRAVNPLVATTRKYGTLTESRLRHLRQQRNVVLQFLAIVRDTVRQAQGNFLYAHQMMEQIGPLSDDSIINAWLLARRAEDLGLVVDDQTINQFLRDVTQGKLGSEEVRGILRGMNDVPVPFFFDALRNELLALRARELLSMGLSATTPGQRWEYFQRLNRKVTIESVALPVERFLAQVSEQPSENELRAFFDEYKMKLADPLSPEPGFAQPKRITVEYLKAEYEKFLDRVEVTEEEIAKFYEENKDRLYTREPLPVGPESQPETPAADTGAAPAKQAQPETPADSSTPTEQQTTPAEGPAMTGPQPPKPEKAGAASPEKEQAPKEPETGEQTPDEPSGEPEQTPSESEKAAPQSSPEGPKEPEEPEKAESPPAEKSPAPADEDSSGSGSGDSQPPTDSSKPAEHPAGGAARATQYLPVQFAAYRAESTGEEQPAKASESNTSPDKAEAPGKEAGESQPAAGSSADSESSKKQPQAEAAGPLPALTSPGKGAASDSAPGTPSGAPMPGKAEVPSDSNPQAATSPSGQAAEKATDSEQADRAAEQSGEEGKAQQPETTEGGETKPAPTYIPLDEVREEIRKTIARRKAPEEMRRLLNSLQTKLSTYREQKILYDVSSGKQKDGQTAQPPKRPNFEQLAKENGLTAGKLTMVSEYEIQQTEIGRSSSVYGGSFVEIAFDRLPEFEPAISQDTESNQYLFWKVEQVERKIPEFDEPGVRDQVLRAWKMRLARKLALQEAERLAEQARQAGKPLKEVFADRPELRVTESQPFTWLTAGAMPTFWTMQPPKLSEVEGVDHPGDAFMQAVFQLQPGELGTAMNHPQTVAYVFRLVESNPSEEVLWQQFLSASIYSYYPALLREQYAMQQALMDQIKADAGFRWDPNWLREQVQSRR